MQETAILSEKMSDFARITYERKYAWKDEDDNVVETWPETAFRVASNVMGALGYDVNSFEVQKITELIAQRKFIAGGRYLYASGRELHQTQNCLLLRGEDSREGWADLLWKSTMALMTGAGIGVVLSDIRAYGTLIGKTGGYATGPLSPAYMINEAGRHIMQGGSRRSAIWMGLHWWHADIFRFIAAKDWSPEVRALKAKDFNFPAALDMTNISVILDRSFFDAFDDETDPLHEHAQSVYWTTVRRMIKTGEPGFSVDYDNPRESLRNACTEITSEDDSDICNLGSINLSRIESPEEMDEVVRYATLFLLAGTVYSHVPYPAVDDTRTKNRRLGLGLMGVHEWLLARDYRYEPVDELEEWLDIYARSTGYAWEWADAHGLSRPVKTRAIAPNGTIGIIGETTTSAEPVFCVAYKRRYLEGDRWVHQYVVDPTASRLVARGVDPNKIEDAYTLAMDVERRVAFQAWLQQWVDHGISSTINLPYPIIDEVEVDSFGKMLYTYLPKLRGVTCYPDGARDGQPLTVASYQEAVKHPGVIFEESEDRCAAGSCGV